MTKTQRGIAMAIAGASLWGGSGAGAQLLFSTSAVTTPWLVSLRLIASGLVLTLFSLIKRPQRVRLILTTQRDLVLLVAFALFGMLNSQLTYFLAIKASNAPTATILQYLQPVMIIAWLAVRNRTWPRRIDTFSIGIALVGTFLLVTGGRLNQLSLTPRALFWGFWCALAATLYTLIPRRLLAKYDSLLVCGLAMLIGGLVCLPNLFLTPWPSLSPTNWAVIAYIVIFGTMLSYTLFLGSINYVSPAVTAILSAFEPLVATGLAVAFLGTRLTGAALVGSLLILLTTAVQALPLKQIRRIVTHGRKIG